MLYHCNFGYPVVDESAVLEAVEHKITPKDEHSAADIDNWNKFIISVLKQEPISNYIPSLKQYFQSPSSHIDFGIALWNTKIEFKKISF